MRMNTAREPVYTHEGGKAQHINAEQALRRSVMACMLWEKTFYEGGNDIAARIADLVPRVDHGKVAEIAIEAREKMNLRHAPLLIAREMARLKSHKQMVGHVLPRIIQRADEITEFLAIYWKDGRQPLSSQVKKGLASAFNKFDAYQLAKYNRPDAIKIRDAMFLCHPKPKDKDQEAVWRALVDGELAPPDTWEVALSSGGDKKAHWERLLSEGKLGAMALLRNLRNFQKAGVNEDLVLSAMENLRPGRVLPFRFISAAKYAPQWEPEIEKAMLSSLSSHDKLRGHTVFLVDVSGSMKSSISDRSEISRMDAACGVAMLLREVCEKIDIFSFSMALKRIPARRGFALRDAIVNSQEHRGTPLGLAVDSIYAPESQRVHKLHFGWYGHQVVDFIGQGLRPDRLIVITDEQQGDSVRAPVGRGYMVNVATYKNGVGYGSWTHIDGWSEAVVDYIRAVEDELG